MKVLADWIPIIVFFIAFKTYDIFIATASAIITTIIMMLLLKIFKKKIEKIQWISLLLIVIFGGATILLQDEQFIKMKPTLLYLIFALVLLIPQFFGRILIKTLLQNQLSLPKNVWKKLNSAWIIFFFFLAFLNFYIAENYSTDYWVNFKLFGMLGITIVFTIIQAIWLSRYKS